ncbi:FxSxx-COOH cyclophane-containing RiPP peptide [Amycolatopsis sp. NBC_01286]|uniref:FxSxx-COOH cyclophane-containing RiPP peptide n=1 Tax=Amycolatopsis sp. NBC_01286 TaxID=2903560 RepID=UPI003FA3DC94
MTQPKTSQGSGLVDVSSVTLDSLRDLDDSVLAHSLRRFQREADDARDPIAAFGAFNQHSSSPW